MVGTTTEPVSVLWVGGEAEPADPARLDDEGFSVRTATGEESALTRLDDGPVDCVVSAYDLADGDGIGLLEAVRDRAPDLPFLLYTSEGSEAVASEAISAGVTDYLRRDGDGAGRDDLGERIESAVAEYRDRRETADQKKRLDLFFEQSPLGVVEWNDEFELVRMNESAEEILGYDTTDLAGRSWEAIVPESDRESVGRVVDELLENEGGFHSINENVRKDGERVVCEWHNRVVTDDGDVVAVFSQFQDVTDQRERQSELERSEKRYRNLVENSPVPINLFDRDGNTVWGNDAVLDLLGLEDRAELVGRSIFEFIHPDDGDVAESELADVIDEEAVVGPTDFRLVRTDGETRHVRIKTTAGWFEGERVGQAVVVDVTELREKEAEIREKERRYRTLVEMSPDPIVVHTDGEIRFANDAFARQVGVNRIDAVVGTSILDYLPPAEHEDAVETARLTQQGERNPTNNQREMRTVDGERRFIRTTSRPIVYDGGSAVLTILNDRTQEHRYRTAVESLHENTREMFRKEDAASIAAVAVEAAATLIDLPGGTVFEFDEAENALVAIAQSETITTALGELPPIGPGSDDVVWETFVEGTRRHVTDPPTDDRIPDTLTIADGLYIPLGDHGVFATAALDGTELSDTEVELCSILAANLEAALDSVEREATLREREERLERQTEALETLEHLNGIIRDINRSLFDATTREAVRAAVCERLGDREGYAAVWIGQRNADLDRFLPVSTDGSMGNLADEIADGSGTSPLQSLLERSVTAGAVHTVDRALKADEWESMRETALQYGFQSVAAVPIPLRNEPDEVLVVHAGQSAAFTEDQRDVFDELGRMIGSAMGAMGPTSGQLARAGTELDVRIADDRLVYNRIAARLDATVTLEGAMPTGDGTHVGFFRTDATPDEVTALADEIHALASVDVLVDDGSAGFYRCTGTASPLFDLLSDHDTGVQSMETHDGVTSITLRVPETTSVRDLHEGLQGEFPDSELVARRSNVAPVETPMTVRATVRAACTDRQYQALQAAFYGGYYEWPRSATNEDLADALDIASPTYQSHRRAAERAVMTTLFEEGG